MQSNNYAYVNGRFVPEAEATVSIFDRGFLYGDGVFETMRVYDGQVFRLHEHLVRLFDALAHFKIESPLPAEELRTVCNVLVERNQVRNGFARVYATSGRNQLGATTVSQHGASLVATAGPIEFESPQLRLIISSVRLDPALSRFKTANRLPYITARREAERAGASVIVRSAPAFVGVLSGAAAHSYQPLPGGESAILVLCGSHVPRSTRQLSRLTERRPESVVWVSAQRLAGGECEAEVASAAVAASDRLQAGGLAVVATSRAVFDSSDRVRSGAAIASGLAAILSRLRGRTDIVVSKGGITSAVNIREGLNSGLAEVLGPVRDGISLWSVDTPERKGLPFVVFPGNVGGDDELVDLIDAIGAAA